MPSNYLIHYGTKNQKWGVRRWQNYDGSLTPEGRVHYGIGDPRKQKELSELASKDPKGFLLNPQQKYRKAVSKVKENPDVHKMARLLSTYRHEHDKKLEELQTKLEAMPRATDEDRHRYFSSNELKEYKKELDDYYNDYPNQVQALADELLGEYGNTPITEYSPNMGFGNPDASDVVKDAVHELAGRYKDISIFDDNGEFVAFDPIKLYGTHGSVARAGYELFDDEYSDINNAERYDEFYEDPERYYIRRRR